MAILKNGIFGKLSGKLGGKVYSSWNGVEVVKDLPKKSTKEPTQLQLDQREKFALCIAFFRCICAVLNVGFKPVAKKMTPRNAAMKYNRDIVLGASGSYSIDFSKVRISKGNLTTPGSVKLHCGPKGLLLVDYENEIGFGESTDLVFVLFYNETINECFVIEGALSRRDRQLVFYKQKETWDDIVHVWFFFKNANRNKVSNSAYLGTG